MTENSNIRLDRHVPKRELCSYLFTLAVSIFDRFGTLTVGGQGIGIFHHIILHYPTPKFQRFRGGWRQLRYFSPKKGLTLATTHEYYPSCTTFYSRLVQQSNQIAIV